jgi:hypothetical protein
MSIDDISRKWIAFGKKELNELFAQVQDLAINIKVFSVIADASKNKRIKHQCFFGWLQRSCIFPLAVIDGLKLCNQYNGYLKSVFLDRNILSQDQYGKLMKTCLRKGLKKDFEQCVRHLEDFRNKRLAHLENTKVKAVSYDLKTLLLLLADLYSGMIAIILFLENPSYIMKEQWNVHILPDTEEKRLSVFNTLFTQSWVVSNCIDILNLAEKEKTST